MVDALPGVTRVEHARESECCGFGGTFSLKHRYLRRHGRDKIASACATGCERLVSADCGCSLTSAMPPFTGRAAAGGAPASFLWRRTGGRGRHERPCSHPQRPARRGARERMLGRLRAARAEARPAWRQLRQMRQARRH